MMEKSSLEVPRRHFKRTRHFLLETVQTHNLLTKPFVAAIPFIEDSSLSKAEKFFLRYTARRANLARQHVTGVASLVRKGIRLAERVAR
ncbi:MAG TPA: hypothetical protein VI957_03650 [Candidatus Paceibacterota bacterium]